MDDDLEYYEARALQEAEAAASSDVSEAVIVHRRLAARYEAEAFMLRASREQASEVAEA